MSIQSITAKQRREGGDSSPNNQPGLVQRRTSHYDVVHLGTTTDADILNDVRVPQPKNLFGAGSFLRVVERQLTRRSPVFSELAVQYEAPNLSIVTQNPLDLPTKVKYITVNTEEAVDVDINGNPIETIAGEKFEPEVREIKSMPVLWLQKPLAYDPGFLIKQYMTPSPATNSDTFRGHPPGALAMWGMEAEAVENDDFIYFVLTIQIALRDAAPGSTVERAWWKRLKAQGYFVLYADQFEEAFVPAMREGKPVGKPVLHNKDTGFELPKGSDAQWYEFQTRPSRPFNSLPI